MFEKHSLNLYLSWVIGLGLKSRSSKVYPK